MNASPRRPRQPFSAGILPGRRLWILTALTLLAIAFPGRAHAVLKDSPHDFSYSNSIAPGGSCAACHKPHRADPGGYRIWARNLSPYRPPSGLILDGGTDLNYLAPPTLQCYDCHDYHDGGGSETNFPNNVPVKTDFASGRYPQNIAFGFRSISVGTMQEDPPEGTISGYYENQPPFTGAGGNYGADPDLKPDNAAQLIKTGGHYYKYLDPTGSPNDNADIGDKLSCRICHEPHTYSSSWQAFIRQDWPSPSTVWTRLQAWSGQASEFMANDPKTGSRLNSESRKVCVACHGYALPSTVLPVQFSEISDAFRTNNNRIVRPTADIDEHLEGNTKACVPCHKHNGIEASCSQCHFYPGKQGGVQATPVHRIHVNLATDTPVGRGFKCKTCHFGYDHNKSQVNDASEWAAKFNRAYVDVSFDNAWNPPGAAYNPSTWQCTGLYCHGNAAPQASWGGTTTSNPPRWDNSVSAPCGSCHGTGTAIRTKNHPVHLDNAAYRYGPNTINPASCGTGALCHSAYGLSPDNTHVDRYVGLRSSPSSGAYDNVPFASTNVCALCHSTATAALDNGAGTGVGNTLAKANWADNAYRLPCLTCHNAAGPRGNTKIDGSGGFAPNVEAYWGATGHGAEIVDNQATNGPGQNLPLACGSCHVLSTAHFGPAKNTVNPWRLDNTRIANDNGVLDRWCAETCHLTVPPPDHTYNVSTAPPETKEPGDAHRTGKDFVPTTTPGPYRIPPASMPLLPFMANKGFNQAGAPVTTKFICVSCHDPHGTGSVAAVPRQFTGVIDSGAGNVHMLRMNYEDGVGSDLCLACHAP